VICLPFTQSLFPYLSYQTQTEVNFVAELTFHKHTRRKSVTASVTTTDNHASLSRLKLHFEGLMLTVNIILHCRGLRFVSRN